MACPLHIYTWVCIYVSVHFVRWLCVPMIHACVHACVLSVCAPIMYACTFVCCVCEGVEKCVCVCVCVCTHCIFVWLYEMWSDFSVYSGIHFDWNTAVLYSIQYSEGIRPLAHSHTRFIVILIRYSIVQKVSSKIKW